jgi:hypothetical protein
MSERKELEDSLLSGTWEVDCVKMTLCFPIPPWGLLMSFDYPTCFRLDRVHAGQNEAIMN